MRLLIAVFAPFAALLAIALLVDAAPKHTPPAAKQPETSSAPLQPATKAPYAEPTPADPAQVIMVRPDSPGLAPIGPGMVATTPSVNIAQDQIVPPLNIFFLQPTASDNHNVISTVTATINKIKVTVNSTLAADNYLRLYNAGAGFNGCASSSNLIYEAVIKQTTGLDDTWPSGIGGFVSGVSICITGGYTTSDGSNATANAMNVIIGWH